MEFEEKVMQTTQCKLRGKVGLQSKEEVVRVCQRSLDRQWAKLWRWRKKVFHMGLKPIEGMVEDEMLGNNASNWHLIGLQISQETEQQKQQSSHGNLHLKCTFHPRIFRDAKRFHKSNIIIWFSD